MSTRFYFRKTNSEEIMSAIRKCSFILVEDLEYLREKLFHLKIGIRTGNSRPTFYKSPFYSNIKELEDFWLSQDDMIIINEYGTEMTWNQLKEELINWNKNKPSNMWRYPELREYEYLDEYGYYWHKI